MNKNSNHQSESLHMARDPENFFCSLPESHTHKSSLNNNHDRIMYSYNTLDKKSLARLYNNQPWLFSLKIYSTQPIRKSYE